MYIITPKIKKSLFIKRTKPLESSLEKIEVIKDESGAPRKYYHFNVYVEIDKRYAIEKDLQTVEIEIIDRPLALVNYREKLFDNINTAIPADINLIAKNALSVKVDQALFKKNNYGALNVGSVSSDSIINSTNVAKLKSNLENVPDIELFGSKKSYRLTKNSKRSTSKNSRGRKNKDYMDIPKPRSSQPTSETDRDKFKKLFSKLTRSGKDPAVLISQQIPNSAIQTNIERIKGRFAGLQKQSQSQSSALLNRTLIDSVRSNNLASGNNEIFSLKFEEKSNRVGIVKQKIILSENVFRKFKKEELRLMFTARDKRKVAIDVSEGVIKYNKEKEKLSFPNFDFEVNAEKNASKQILLQITNNDHIDRFFNVYSKQLSGYMPKEFISFKLKIGSVRVPARSKVTLFRKGYHFKTNRSVFFRVNLVHDQIEYGNSKFASCEVRGTQEYENYVGITAAVQKDQIAVQVRNIPDSTVKVELHRTNLSKSEKKYNVIKSYNSKNNQLLNHRGFMIRPDTSDPRYTFYDQNVKPNNSYKYRVVLYDVTGVKRMSSNCAVEQFVKSSGFLNVQSNFKVVSLRGDRKSIDITGNVTKNQTDADKVFKDLFGRFYDLFEDDLKQIKDLNALSTNIMIDRINRDTSEVQTYKDVGADEQGNFQCKITLSDSFDYVIKMTPRVLPPSEILSKINKSLPDLAKKARFLPVSAFNTAAIKRVLKNKTRGVVSVMGDKFSHVSLRTQGQIQDSKTRLNRTNFDSYFDGDTGDISYLLIESTTKRFTLSNSIISIRGTIKNLNLTNRDKTQINKRNNEIKNDCFLLSFNVANNSKFIDFFVMSYKENGDSNVTGVCSPPINRETMLVKYVFKTPVLYGKISFFAQPVLKDGSVLDPVLISTIYKDEEGVK